MSDRRKFADEGSSRTDGARDRQRSRSRCRDGDRQAPSKPAAVLAPTPVASTTPTPSIAPGLPGIHPGMPNMAQDSSAMLRYQQQMMGNAHMSAMAGMPGAMPTMNQPSLLTLEQLQLLNQHGMSHLTPMRPLVPVAAPADEEVDPLDAFMNDIEKEVKAKNPKSKKPLDIKDARDSFGPAAYTRLRPHGWSERLGPDSMLEDKGTR
eukprot:GEMP01035494.1.p1 GENE.GEMP01035494.1~~GEMP01035494.1.p1  ORF type:complete len:207 (+),score=56.73 GEMP01035494.1:87-707(+)